MKKMFVFIPFILFISIAGFYVFDIISTKKIISPQGKIIEQKKEKPFDKYSYEHLKKTNFEKSDIHIGKKLGDGKGFASYIYYYKVNGKKISGLLNLPDKSGTYPVIVMFRGYVDKEIYETGVGTRHAGEVFAQNGFITMAPDFLGYGESDKASNDAIEDRLQTYTTALTLLSSIGSLNKAMESSSFIDIKSDPQKIGIWGHSNGGQIALSLLEITGKNYPAVLWAPVSKPFPYSILYYTDEFEDHGKKLRKVVADFEKNYDVEKYSLTNYFDWINTPVQIHQGGADEDVPKTWSDQLVEELKKSDKEVEYFIYPEQDHNFSSSSWSTAVLRNISFYKEQFAK